MSKKKKNQFNMNYFQHQLPDVLATAIQFHQSGNLREAEELYNQILRSNPNHVDALHLLGVIAYQSGLNKRATELISKAIRENGTIPYFHNNLGNALKSQGDLQGAIECYKEAIRLKSDYAEAKNNLGNAFEDIGDVEKAVYYFQEAIKAKPDYGDAYNNLGNACRAQGRFDEAIKHYKKAIVLKPDFPEFHYNLGNALKERNRPDEAIACYEEAIRLKPDFYQAYNNLGNVYGKEGKIDSSLACYQEGLRQNPHFAEARHNLAWAYNECGNNHKKNCELDKAIDYYDDALRVKPDLPEAHYNKGIALLLMGKIEEGWTEYEWRFKVDKIVKQIGEHTFAQPRWDGSLLSGKIILVHTEQGAGDTFQFIRYLPMVKSLGGRVIFLCQRELMHVLDGFPGVDQLVEKQAVSSTKVRFDTHIPLLSIPGVFGTGLDDIPSDVPYLSADPHLLKEWGNKLAAKSFKVGLVWAGNPEHNNDHNRSCNLSDFIPLLSIPGLTLFSLQKGVAATQLKEIKGELDIVDLGKELNDFSDTAAVLANLDLLISVDTAVVHLAGAMGMPTWTLLPFLPDWRWMIERGDSPWYPTMRLFRQSKRQGWDEVIQDVKKELEKLVFDAMSGRGGFLKSDKNRQNVSEYYC